MTDHQTHIFCPASGCGRKTPLRKDGTIGSHNWTGNNRCAAYRKTPEQAATIGATGGPAIRLFRGQY